MLKLACLQVDSRGSHDPVSPWGVLTKGYKTRSNKRTRGMIIQFRHKK